MGLIFFPNWKKCSLTKYMHTHRLINGYMCALKSAFYLFSTSCSQRIWFNMPHFKICRQYIFKATIFAGLGIWKQRKSQIVLGVCSKKGKFSRFFSVAPWGVSKYISYLIIGYQRVPPKCSPVSWTDGISHLWKKKLFINFRTLRMICLLSIKYKCICANK